MKLGKNIEIEPYEIALIGLFTYLIACALHG